MYDLQKGMGRRMSGEITKTTKKKQWLVNVYAEIDLSGMLWPRTYPTIQEKAKRLDEAAKELRDFLNDHRSQDSLDIQIIREYAIICTACGETWEDLDDDGPLACAYCGAELEEQPHE